MSVAVAENAFVHPEAQLADDVEIGPFCVIGPHVAIGRGTRLMNNVTVAGRTTIGEHNHIFPGAVIGADPQDISYRGSETCVTIGSHNTIRECVTINRATEKEEGITSLGDWNYLMAGCHVAHDCRIGDHVIIANATLLGGHVRIDDHATLSGAAAVHHFATIGRYSFVAGMSRVVNDVPPYLLIEGVPARPRCINKVALERNDFPRDVIAGLHTAYKLIYISKIGLDNVREILRESHQLYPAVNHLLGSIQMLQEGRHGRARERRRAA
jgi:UDP-N-acetylglucosamine acyltransferase